MSVPAVRCVAAGCDPGAQVKPLSEHFWWYSIHVENYTRQGVHLIVKQDGTLLFDKVVPGDWARRTDPAYDPAALKGGEPLKRDFRVHLEDSAKEIEVEETDLLRSKWRFSVKGFTESPDNDFTLRVRPGEVALSQDRPVYGTLEDPDERAQFTAAEATWRREEGCTYFWIVNETARDAQIQVFVDGRLEIETTVPERSFDDGTRLTPDGDRYAPAHPTPFWTQQWPFTFDPSMKEFRVVRVKPWPKEWRFSGRVLWSQQLDEPTAYPTLTISESDATLTAGHEM